MKLLLDQNVSYRLVEQLAEEYPGTSHVRLLGMSDADDLTIWEYAQREGYAIVTHDADFEAFSVLLSPGPLVVWLRCGNQPNSLIFDRLLEHRLTIESAHEDPGQRCVEIY